MNLLVTILPFLLQNIKQAQDLNHLLRTLIDLASSDLVRFQADKLFITFGQFHEYGEEWDRCDFSLLKKYCDKFLEQALKFYIH